MKDPLTVGVLGGMGPEATLDFFAKLLAADQAGREQDRLRILIDSNPQLPDRNLAVAGKGPSPGPGIAEMARGLQDAGAQLLVMPCNTAHAFKDEFLPQLRVPFLSIVDVTADAVAQLMSSAGATGGKAGLLATSGTRESRIYEKALAERGIEAVALDADGLRTFMDLLYRIKRDGSRVEEHRAAMRELAHSLLEQGCQVVVAACTEVPLVLTESELGAPLVSSTDELVRATLTAARGADGPS